jgi:hypothetical protein
MPSDPCFAAMPKVYIRGGTLRISLREGGPGAVYRVHDVGRRGHTLRLAMRVGGRWVTKSWWLRLRDFRSADEVAERIRSLRIPRRLARRAERLARDYFGG